MLSTSCFIRNSSEMTVEEWDHVKHWRDPVYGNIFIVLTVFIVRWGTL